MEGSVIPTLNFFPVSRSFSPLLQKRALPSVGVSYNLLRFFPDSTIDALLLANV